MEKLSVLSLEEIQNFHPHLRPHFLTSLGHDLWPFRINVFVNENSRFVIAAPHGYRKDDRNTDILAHALADKLQANAVINCGRYRKPKRADDPRAEEIIVANPVALTSAELALRNGFIRETSAIPVDLNKWRDAMIAAPDFFHPLTSITSMICRNSTPLVVFVHGIADHNHSGQRNPDFVVAAGYEYVNKARAYRTDRTTASKSVVEGLVSGLRKLERNGSQAWVEEGLPGYAAAKPERMPWIFKMLAGGTNGRLSVNAIQLEVRHKGLREVENIPSTARKLASVLRDT
jgi:hypothetical protein